MQTGREQGLEQWLLPAPHQSPRGRRPQVLTQGPAPHSVVSAEVSQSTGPFDCVQSSCEPDDWLLVVLPHRMACLYLDSVKRMFAVQTSVMVGLLLLLLLLQPSACPHSSILPGQSTCDVRICRE